LRKDLPVIAEMGLRRETLPAREFVEKARERLLARASPNGSLDFATTYGAAMKY